MSISPEATPDTTNTPPDAHKEPQDAPEAPGTTDASETPEPTDGDTEGTEGTEGKGDREAAKLRKRAQAAEQELTTLRERVGEMQRNEAERIASGAGNLRDATDLWSFATMDQLIDETGALDAEKVAEKVAEIVAEKPHFAEPDLPVDGFDLGGNRPHVRAVESSDWQQVLQR